MKHTEGRKAAFPRPYSRDDYCDRPQECGDQEGMTMREWYAGMAMIGIIARDPYDGSGLMTAREAFVIADKMLAEAAKEKP